MEILVYKSSILCITGLFTHWTYMLLAIGNRLAEILLYYWCAGRYMNARQPFGPHTREVDRLSLDGSLCGKNIKLASRRTGPIASNHDQSLIVAYTESIPGSVLAACSLVARHVRATLQDLSSGSLKFTGHFVQIKWGPQAIIVYTACVGICKYCNSTAFAWLMFERFKCNETIYNGVRHHFAIGTILKLYPQGMKQELRALRLYQVRHTVFQNLFRQIDSCLVFH